MQVSISDYHSYHLGKYQEERQQENARPLYIAKDLFNTAYNWDPMGPTGGWDLHEMLGSGRFEKIILGKFQGEISFGHIPDIGILESTELTVDCTQLELAYTDGGAISYPGGHPSEAEHHTVKTSSPKEGTLRRFMSLGWVIRLDSTVEHGWERTGHVLVMDMDEGRHRHPWIVLASHWPDDRDYPDNDDFLVYAKDSDAYGVLPGTNNRTPIGRLYPNPKVAPPSRPILLELGPDFEFGITRLGGGQRQGVCLGRGSNLANIMHWYDDVAKDEEVCFGPDGKVCMRYNRQTKQYRYGDPDTAAWRLPSVEPSQDFVPVSSRIGGGVTEAQRRARESHASSSQT